jgi:hypothetical protein
MNVIEASNLSFAEFYRLNGVVTPERAEQAIAALEEVPQYEEARDRLGSVAGFFPDEDFLDEALDLARDLVKNCKGSNVKVAVDLLANLEQLQTTVGQHRDEGVSEVEEAIRLLGG